MQTQRKRCLLAAYISLTVLLPTAMAALEPDAGDEDAVASPCGTVPDPLGPDCDTFGTFLNRASNPYLYRGNVYGFDSPAVLKEIRMELDFDGTTDLHVAIHRRQPNGDYIRYPENSSDIVIPNAEGCGANVRHFYSTADANPPMEPVTIEAGFDYAIAFAWGDKFVGHGRGGPGYVLPFRAGQVRGLVTAFLSHPPDPLVPEIFTDLEIFNSSVYSMELCFEPQPGACCFFEDGCREVIETDCVGAGSFFHGEYKLCAETPCIFGACCTRCGECLRHYTEESCFAADGANHWPGVDCADVDSESFCPPVTGACCRAGGLCELTCRRDCENPPSPEPPGVYHGDGTTCSPDPCKGACCVDGFGCQDFTADDCTAFEGTFRGVRTSCETLPPGQECRGACCYGPNSPTTTGFTTCSDVNLRTSCKYNSFPRTAYLGESKVCPDRLDEVPAFCGQISDYHACCLLGVANACINTTVDACPLNVGDFHDNVQCPLPGGCAPAQRACCLPNGLCTIATSGSCAAVGGVWQRSLASCDPSPCVSGACCGTGVGDCIVKTAARCGTDGGIYRGDGTNCDAENETCPGFGACCRVDGDCFDDFTLEQCNTIGGEYQGPASDCQSTLDCDERGACCAITGACLTITQSQCNELVPPGEFRVGEACPADDRCPAGACCLGSGCEVRTDLGCTDFAGVFQGVDVSCAANLCVVGACCNGDACSSQTRHTCERDGGAYLGDGVACAESVCTLGACCRNETCSQLQALLCAQQNGVFLGEGVVCGTGICNVGACCRTETCQTGIGYVCIHEAGAYLGDGTDCGVDVCTLGACCAGFVCNRDIRFSCEGDGLVFKGPGTTCDGQTPCPCTIDAQCDDGDACTTIDHCGNGSCLNDRRNGSAEFAQMVPCVRGPDQPIPPGCACFDLHPDNHVDMRDVAKFFLAFEAP